MKLVAICVTYRRPELVAQLVRMFELQSYFHGSRRLLIYDDAGEYEEHEGDGWIVVSRPDRVRSHGQKRNLACAKAAEIWPDLEGYAVWDDDDIYFPWAMEACADALTRGAWGVPSLVWDDGQRWGEASPLLTESYSRQQGFEFACYHGSWCYRRDAFEAVKGYDTHTAGDRDMQFAKRLRLRFGPPADTLSERFPEPYYVYRRDIAPARISDFGYTSNATTIRPEDLAKWGTSGPKIERIVPQWPPHYCRMPKKQPIARPW